MKSRHGGPLAASLRSIGQRGAHARPRCDQTPDSTRCNKSSLFACDLNLRHGAAPESRATSVVCVSLTRALHQTRAPGRAQFAHSTSTSAPLNSPTKNCTHLRRTRSVHSTVRPITISAAAKSHSIPPRRRSKRAETSATNERAIRRRNRLTDPKLRLARTVHHLLLRTLDEGRRGRQLLRCRVVDH
jgi:hypothetical protein